MAHNKPNSYQIVTSEGKVIETFRIKFTASQMLPKLKEIYGEDLEIEGVYGLK